MLNLNMLKSSRDKIEPGGGESNSPRWGNAFGSLPDRDDNADHTANVHDKSQSGLSDYHFAIEQDGMRFGFLLKTESRNPDLIY
jgi:hypothetical protein